MKTALFYAGLLISAWCVLKIGMYTIRYFVLYV